MDGHQATEINNKSVVSPSASVLGIQSPMNHEHKFSDFDDLGEKSLGFSGFDQGDVEDDES